MGDSCSYDHAFAKRHDDDITVLPCTLGEPVCGEERANDGVPFFYFYQVVFKSIGVRLPFSRFERELLTWLKGVSILTWLSYTWRASRRHDPIWGRFCPSGDVSTCESSCLGVLLRKG